MQAPGIPSSWEAGWVEVRPRREGKRLGQGRGELPGQEPRDPPEARGYCGQRQASGARLLLPRQRDQNLDKEFGGRSLEEKL